MLDQVDDTTGSERRVHPRMAFFRPVNLYDTGRNCLHKLTTGNISRGGLFVKSDHPLPEGTNVVITFRINKDSMWVDVGTIVWTTRGNLPGMGVRFGSLSNESRQQIDALIESSAR